MTPLPILFKALSDGNRLRIVMALAEQEELCACQLIDLLGLAGATTSRHLAVLAQAELLASRKAGRWVHYRLHPELRAERALLDWLVARWEEAPEREADRRALRAILCCRPEEICARQRKSSCC